MFKSPIAPVRRHLAAAGSGIVFRAHRLQQHVVGSDAEHEHQRAVAVIREEPIVTWFQHQTRRHLDGFVARAADLKEDLILALELNLAIVQTPREKHGAIDADQRVAVEALVFRWVVIR